MSPCGESPGNRAPRDTFNWQPAPPGIPAGARAVVLKGDPTKTGPFTIRLDMPEGFEVKPHHHPTAENVHVVEGTLLVGHGKNWADSALAPLAAGQDGSIPAKQPHFVRAKEHTVLDIRSTGPFVISYENPADDPRNKAIP
jgi:quercetin dioxygenase-like cupin family protein